MSTSVPPIPENIFSSSTVAAPDLTQGSGLSAETAQLKVSTIGDLQAQAPQLFDAMMMGIAMQIHNEQERYMDRMRKQQREMRHS